MGEKIRRMTQDGDYERDAREPRRDGIYPGREDVGRQWDGITKSRVAEPNVVCNLHAM